MHTMPLTFSRQLEESAVFLLERQNPDDHGWGLNIEKGYQASSIVNTSEAIFVINRSGVEFDTSRVVDYLKESIREHPTHRGDHLRYYTFGLLGLLEAGIDRKDSLILGISKIIEERQIEGIGWADSTNETSPRIWPTFQALWSLMRVYGSEYIRTKYCKCLSSVLSEGRSNDYRWGFEVGSTPSLAATSYVLILLSELFPDSPDTLQAHNCVTAMLDDVLGRHRPMELEAIGGTDWHHYAYCWALKAIQYNSTIDNHSVTVNGLKYIESLFQKGKGYIEPGKPFCNVRSIFNNILAVSSVKEQFDPIQYINLEKEMGTKDINVIPKSIFLSYSYRTEDKELVEGLRKLLESFGYTVITGEKNPMGSLSKSILKKISESEMFVIVMTRRDKKENGKYTTSGWLLEEKGAALALGKPTLMLIEDGIDTNEIGGLQGDDQRLSFTRNNFSSVVADAIEMLLK